MLTQDEGLGAHRGSPVLARGRVAVDGDEHVGVVTVGDVGPVAEGDKHILHVRQILLDVVAREQGHGEVQVLLLADGTQGTRVLSTVSRVNHHGRDFLAPLGN